MADGYQIYLLPKSHPDAAVWAEVNQRYRDLRLQSLQISPESFSSTYAREIEFTGSQWEARLKNPIAFSLVAVRPTIPKTNVEDLIGGVWVGNVVLLGPFDEQPAVDQNHPKFDINALFVMPEERRHGLGKGLVQAAIDHGKVLGRETGAKEVIFQLLVLPSNTDVVNWYKGLGFGLAGSGSGSEGGGMVTLELRVSLELDGA